MNYCNKYNKTIVTGPLSKAQVKKLAWKQTDFMKSENRALICCFEQ